MPLQLETIDGGHQIVAVVGGGLHDRCRSGEGHDADADIRRLFLNEGLGRRLRGDHPIRLDVARAHAERNIHCEDDGALVGGQRDDRAGTRDRKNRGDHADQKQQRRNVAAESITRPQRGLNQA